MKLHKIGKSGMFEGHYYQTYPVIVWPNKTLNEVNHRFTETPGLALGIEYNNLGGKRLIVRLLKQAAWRGSKAPASWPNNIVYCAARDIDGWRQGHEETPEFLNELSIALKESAR